MASQQEAYIVLVKCGEWPVVYDQKLETKQQWQLFWTNSCSINSVMHCDNDHASLTVNCR